MFMYSILNSSFFTAVGPSRLEVHAVQIVVNVQEHEAVGFPYQQSNCEQQMLLHIAYLEG